METETPQSQPVPPTQTQPEPDTPDEDMAEVISSLKGEIETLKQGEGSSKARIKALEEKLAAYEDTKKDPDYDDFP